MSEHTGRVTRFFCVPVRSRVFYRNQGQLALAHDITKYDAQ